MPRDNLARLLDEARDVTMTEAEREEQRRSFVFGNVNIENDRVTRQMVDDVAESLQAKSSDEE